MAISLGLKRDNNQKGRHRKVGRIHETLIHKVICVTIFGNASVVTRDTHGPQEYAHHQK